MGEKLRYAIEMAEKAKSAADAARSEAYQAIEFLIRYHDTRGKDPESVKARAQLLQDMDSYRP